MPSQSIFRSDQRLDFGFRLIERFWRSDHGPLAVGRTATPADRIAWRTYQPGDHQLGAYRYDIYEKDLCA